MTHRVKTLFSDRKIPLALRARIPILCDDGGILWIPGFPLRDGTRYEGVGTPLNAVFSVEDGPLSKYFDFGG